MVQHFKIFNLDIERQQSTKKIKKTQRKSKKDLNESIVNGKKHENKETEERARMIEKPEDATAIIRQCEEIIRSKQQNIVCMDGLATSQNFS